MTRLIRNCAKNRSLLLLALPGIVLIFMFEYMPLMGQLVAFKQFDYGKGIFGSPWVGLDNFRFLFTNGKTFTRIVGNTLKYYVIFTLFGTVMNVALAIMLHECIFRRFTRISHTIMIMPTFISFIAVTFIVQGMLDPNGVVNNFLLSIGQKKMNWYTNAKAWPVILTIVKLWKDTGYGSILYLSALSGMDPEVFEAAELDGATKGQQIRYITLPMLTSMISILLLLGLGGIMKSNTGLFYQVTKNTGILYSTTQTIDAYVLNVLTNGSSNYGQTAAVSFFQAAVGSIMVVSVNLIVRRIAPENSLF